jgi:hypothetical protein
MTVSVVEDVYGMPDSSYSVSEGSIWADVDATPQAVTIQDAVEVPYYWLRKTLGDAETLLLPEDAGYGRPLAAAPNGMSDGYDLVARVSPDAYTERARDVQFFYTATLSASVGQAETTMPITGSTIDPEEFGAGYFVIVGTGRNAEWMRVTGGNLTTTITVDRGMLDTTPQNHSSGARVWALRDESVLYDQTRWQDGQTVNYRLLTTTASGTLEEINAPTLSLEMDARQFRPYPPGKVQINGEYFPDDIDVAPVITWEHRDRTATAPFTVLPLQSDTSLSAEPGVTYDIWAYDDSDDALLDSDTGLTGKTWTPEVSGEALIRIEIESKRDGYAAWQRQRRWFNFLGIAVEPLVYLKMEGADGSTTFTDEGGHTVTRTGTGTIVTADYKVGTSSYENPTASSYLEVASISGDLNLSTIDYTIDFWMKRTSFTVSNFISWGGNTTGRASIYTGSTSDSSVVIFETQGTNRISSSSITTSPWRHYALVRRSGVFYFFIDGTLIGTNSTAITHVDWPLYVGQRNGSSNRVIGRFDEVKLTKKALWTSNFTPPGS